jgi:hypothetical protein
MTGKKLKVLIAELGITQLKITRILITINGDLKMNENKEVKK